MFPLYNNECYHGRLPVLNVRQTEAALRRLNVIVGAICVKFSTNAFCLRMKMQKDQCHEVRLRSSADWHFVCFRGLIARRRERLQMRKPLACAEVRSSRIVPHCHRQRAGLVTDVRPKRALKVTSAHRVERRPVILSH